MGNDVQAPPATQDSASFLRRLAGPSIMKAGLAKDQTEINRIIAEASKGSKFYENEKKKDKELTEKITRILKQRDEVLRQADIGKAQQAADHILAKMEAERDLSQLIVHVDMDAFFASVEVLDDPSLAGKPFVVAGGVVSTASYEARKHGVRSGMAEFIARKLCPDLVVVRSHYQRYNDMSKQIFDIFRQYDPEMCAAGCDEGYLNITPYCEEQLITAEECVREMRERVHRETHLTVSAGIAPNKMLAKICSDKNKPNGQFMLEFTPEAVKSFMHDLPIRKVPGVGRVNERLLDSIGIKTCGDIYTHRATLYLMDKQFGLHFLLQTYLGIASNVVAPYVREERKSIGAERTFSTLADKEKILAKLEEVAEELSEDCERSGWTGKTVTLKYKLDTFQVFTRAKSFNRWISTKKEDLFATGKELLLPELPLKLRLIGLRVTKLKDLLEDADAKPGSIKRFFEKTNAPPSPRKKRKLDAKAADDDLALSQDGYEESMPGFDEELENELSVDAAVEAAPSPAGRSNKPSSRQTPKPLSKPASKRARTSTPQPEAETQTCPICSKTMETDNRGLNEHIDYCLSKGAIREAQATASSPSKSSIRQPLPSRDKPTAKMKRKKS